MSGANPITRLLNAASGGDSSAASHLLPLVYEELRALAAARMRKAPPGYTLQATALVHEAYLRVAGDGEASFENRKHFFFVAARAMRDILVEEARKKASLKRGGDRKRVGMENLSLPIEAPAEDMIALSESLDRFKQKYPRKHQLVMLRFFGGATEAAAAELIGVDERTARRDWRFARAWLGEALASNETALDPDDEPHDD